MKSFNRAGHSGKAFIAASKIRNEFPIFHNLREPFIYLDNAATTQKPRSVIERMEKFYFYENANIHRGLYPLSTKASDVYEEARDTVREWIDAESAEEVVFTKSSTEAVNLAAAALFESRIRSGSNVVVTELEHSSNYFPWEHQCIRNGCEFRVAKANGTGEISEKEILKHMDSGTSLIAVTGMSNATGVMPALERLIRKAHEHSIPVFVDATQLIAHKKISVRKLDCDLLCFSGHKLYGPMGVGVLYGKKELLTQMAPFLYGGDMVQLGDRRQIRFREDPGKYEAGTQNIAGAAGLAAALKFLEKNRFEAELLPYEEQLSVYLAKKMEQIPGVVKSGPKEQISSIYSFSLKDCAAYDIGVFLAASGIAVRSGAHCAYPLMKRMGQDATVRISLSFYNTTEEIDLLADRLRVLAERICG